MGKNIIRDFYGKISISIVGNWTWNIYVSQSNMHFIVAVQTVSIYCRCRHFIGKFKVKRYQELCSTWIILDLEHKV